MSLEVLTVFREKNNNKQLKLDIIIKVSKNYCQKESCNETTYSNNSEILLLFFLQSTVVLKFYSPVNTIKVMLSQSVNLLTLSLGKLRPHKR